MKNLFCAVVAFIFVGCAGMRSDLRSNSHGPVTTQFVSSPSGARIEIDGNDVGITPLSYTWPRSYQDGARFRNEVTVKAFPAGAGGRTQKKFFESHHMELPLIPTKIYFDMNAAREVGE